MHEHSKELQGSFNRGGEYLQVLGLKSFLEMSEKYWCAVLSGMCTAF